MATDIVKAFSESNNPYTLRFISPQKESHYQLHRAQIRELSLLAKYLLYIALAIDLILAIINLTSSYIPISDYAPVEIHSARSTNIAILSMFPIEFLFYKIKPLKRIQGLIFISGSFILTIYLHWRSRPDTPLFVPP